MTRAYTIGSEDVEATLQYLAQLKLRSLPVISDADNNAVGTVKLGNLPEGIVSGGTMLAFAADVPAEVRGAVAVDAGAVEAGPGEQFFQQDGNLDAIGRGERVELQGVVADRKFFVMGRSRSRPVNVSKAPAILFVPLPNFRWRIRTVFCHFLSFFSILWSGVAQSLY